MEAQASQHLCRKTATFFWNLQVIASQLAWGGVLLIEHPMRATSNLSRGHQIDARMAERWWSASK